MIAWWYSLPLFRQSHHAAGIEYSKAKQMVKFETDSVHRPVEAVFGIVKRITLRGQNCQVLNVTPRQRGAAGKEEVERKFKVEQHRVILTWLQGRVRRRQLLQALLPTFRNELLCIFRTNPLWPEESNSVRVSRFEVIEFP